MNLLVESIPTSATSRNRLQGIAFIFLAALFWAAMELTGYFVPSQYRALQVVWMRYGTHLIFMIVVFGPRHRADLVRTHHLKLQLFRPVLMIGMPLFFLLSLRFMPLQNAWTTFWVAPLMVMSLAAILLREHIKPVQWLTIIVGFIGVTAIYWPQPGLLHWSIIFPLGMAFCFSLYLILTRMLHAERTITNLFYTALMVFLPWSLGLPFFWQSLNLKALSAMTAIGILGFWSLFFLDKAYERAQVSVLTPFLYAQPLFTIILSYFLFRSIPATTALAGSLILLVVNIFLIFHEIFREKDASNFGLTKEPATKHYYGTNTKDSRNE